MGKIGGKTHFAVGQETAAFVYAEIFDVDHGFAFVAEFVHQKYEVVGQIGLFYEEEVVAAVFVICVNLNLGLIHSFTLETYSYEVPAIVGNFVFIIFYTVVVVAHLNYVFLGLHFLVIMAD